MLAGWLRCFKSALHVGPIVLHNHHSYPSGHSIRSSVSRYSIVQSNASEMREFHFLFLQLFDESSLESSSEILQRIER